MSVDLTGTPETPLPPAPSGSHPPATVQDAYAVLGRFRKIMVRTGGALVVVLAGASLATEPITWTLSLLGLGTVALTYRFPLSRRVRRARELTRGWENMALLRSPPAGSSDGDPRLDAADAVIARLAEHAADPRAVAFGGDVRQQLARMLDDARAVERLRGALSPAEAETRGAALHAQVADRIGKLMGALADVYQAVLAHDDAALDAVLGRGEDVLRQLSARQEVERLLGH